MYNIIYLFYIIYYFIIYCMLSRIFVGYSINILYFNIKFCSWVKKLDFYERRFYKLKIIFLIKINKKNTVINGIIIRVEDFK